MTGVVVGDTNALSIRAGLLAVGGRQRGPQGMRELDEQWYGYGSGVIVSITPNGVDPVLEYRSRPNTFGPGDPELLKSATLVGDRLYACSQTEAMVFDVASLELLHHVSHPLFNDVHHVLPDPETGHLWLAVSGQDLVAEITLDGEIRSLWGVDGSDPTGRIDPDRDYRINTRLKPHPHHPNYLFDMPDGTRWVTRFEQRDAVQIGDVTRRIDIGNERCHDGVVDPTDPSKVYFTTIDGHVVVADTETLDVVDRIPLAGRSDLLLGWCRGLMLTDREVLVGFSRIRHTKVRGALSWVRNGMTASEPTRIAIYDRASWELVDEINLEPAGCNAVFSILPRPVDGTPGSEVER